MQKCGISPTVSALYSKEDPAIANPLSNSPVGPESMVPAVNVCATTSVFENITTPPTSTVATMGL